MREKPCKCTGQCPRADIAARWSGSVGEPVEPDGPPRGRSEQRIAARDIGQPQTGDVCVGDGGLHVTFGPTIGRAGAQGIILAPRAGGGAIDAARRHHQHPSEASVARQRDAGTRKVGVQREFLRRPGGDACEDDDA